MFKGQCIEEIFQLLDSNNILYVLVPAICTDVLQPLDLSLNKSAKDFMRKKFQEWYGSIICKQLEDNVEDTVALRLSTMKPLSAQWMIDMFYYFKSHPDIITNGFVAAGIKDCISS